MPEEESRLWCENAAVTIHLYHTVLELIRRLEKTDFEGRTLTLKVKFAHKREQTEARFQSAEREQTRQNGKFLDFQQITRSVTVDHVLRTKDEILPLAKQLMQSIEFNSHPIRLLGLGVSNPKSPTSNVGQHSQQKSWIELELEFEPWPEP